MEPGIGRVLLVINRSSGTGSDDDVVSRLRVRLVEWAGADIASRTEVVEGHPAVSELTGEFLAASDVPALVIAGGGGGTLRAVVEAVCEGCPPGELPTSDRVRLAALRMGSGNLFAKQLGVPKYAEAGFRGILANAMAGRSTPGCVMRFEVGNEAGGADVHYGVSMGGLGEFGRVPGDLVRWRGNHPRLHASMARLLGLERVNTLEYAAAVFLRSVSVALRPTKSEEIEIRVGSETRVFRILAGAVLNFPVGQLPFRPPVRLEEPTLSIYLLPMTGRAAAAGLVLRRRHLAGSAFQATIAEGESAEIRLRDRRSVEFFIDEDPVVFHETLSIEPAGTLEFVPGPDYDWSPEGESTS